MYLRRIGPTNQKAPGRRSYCRKCDGGLPVRIDVHPFRDLLRRRGKLPREGFEDIFRTKKERVKLESEVLGANASRRSSARNCSPWSARSKRA